MVEWVEVIKRPQDDVCCTCHGKGRAQCHLDHYTPQTMKVSSYDNLPRS